MSDFLPEEVCYQILLRVPAEPLFRFRSVCKTWSCIIGDTTFVKMHVHHHQNEGGDHLMVRYNSGELYTLPLSSLDTKSETVTLTNIVNLTVHVPRLTRLPVPSHSGMILITEKCENKRMWMLWNPFTDDSFVLPPHSLIMMGIDADDICENIPRYGFGYDSKTDDLKVVRILQLRGPEKSFMLETLVYSLKSNTWKRIVNFHDCLQPRAFRGNGVFFNGALHWIADVLAEWPHWQYSERIIAFDLSTEEERVFILPDHKLIDFRLDVLGGYLCLIDYRGIWIMEDYGVNVWTKLVSLTHPVSPTGKPIAYIKNKGQIIFQKDNVFLLFDVEKKCGTKFSIDGFPMNFTSQVLHSSLFRLSRSGDGGHGSIALNKTLRKRSTANRSKVELKIVNVAEVPFSSLD